MTMNDAVLELTNIRKVFPHPDRPIVANDDVCFELRRGEIHALVGENGSGKTTLMNIVYGMLQPDQGRMLLYGAPYAARSPKEAIRHGIGMVHQHFMLIPSFTTAENMVFASEPRRGVFIDRKKTIELAREISTKYALTVDPTEKISNCSLSMRQRVEILKILLHGANILIFDEPTAVLTPQESQELFRAFVELKKAGKSIIFITHKLREVIATADRATIMRKGSVVDTVGIEGTTIEDLAEKMVGRRIDLSTRKGDTLEEVTSGAEEILAVDDLSSGALSSGIRLSHVSFSVRSGEIVGIAGVGGNGQEQVVEVVTGLSGAAVDGTIRYHTRDITRWAAHRIRDIGIAHITGDRYGRGVCTSSSIHANLMMGPHRRRPWTAGPFLRQGRLRARSDELIRDYDIRTNSQRNQIMSLSGGNIQKCIFARELSLAKDLIIAEEPTRGVDIGSTEFIHNQLVEKARSGYGVLLVSTDLDEIMSLSTRILVMFRGEIIGEVDPGAEGLEKRISLLMAGVRS